MINKKDFRAVITEVVKNNEGNCSVCNQQIDSGAMSFANMRGIKTSWRRNKLLLFIPKEITFVIPYSWIERYCVFPGRKQVEIELCNRILISIRGTD